MKIRRELWIDMIIHMGIFKNNQITLFPCLTFIPQTRGSFLQWVLQKSENEFQVEFTSVLFTRSRNT